MVVPSAPRQHNWFYLPKGTDCPMNSEKPIRVLLAVFGAARPEPGRMFQLSPGGRFGRRERVLTLV